MGHSLYIITTTIFDSKWKITNVSQWSNNNFDFDITFPSSYYPLPSPTPSLLHLLALCTPSLPPLSPNPIESSVHLFALLLQKGDMRTRAGLFDVSKVWSALSVLELYFRLYARTKQSHVWQCSHRLLCGLHVAVGYVLCTFIWAQEQMQYGKSCYCVYKK